MASIARSGKPLSFAPVRLSWWQGPGVEGVLLAASLGWMRHAAGVQIPVDRAVEGY